MTSISNIWKQLTSILSKLNNFHSLDVVDWKFRLNNLAIKGLEDCIELILLTNISHNEHTPFLLNVHHGNHSQWRQNRSLASICIGACGLVPVDVDCTVVWYVVCGGVCVAARYCASVRAVSALVILHCVRMTVQLATSLKFKSGGVLKLAFFGLTSWYLWT